MFSFKWLIDTTQVETKSSAVISRTSLFIFSLQPVLHDWCNKGSGVCYPVCGMMHIKEPLLLIGKCSPCDHLLLISCLVTFYFFGYSRLGLASTAPLLKTAQGPPQLHYWRLPRGLHSSTTEDCPGASTTPLLKTAQGPPQLHYWRLPRGLHSSTTEDCPGASTTPLLKTAQGPPQLHYWRLPRGLHNSTTEDCPGASTTPLLKTAQGPPQLHYWRLPRGLHNSTTEDCPGASTTPLLKTAQGLHMSQSGPLSLSEGWCI